MPIGSNAYSIWAGRHVTFRIPSQPFAFPDPRGSDEPWRTGKQAVGELRTIARFRFEAMEVTSADEASGDRDEADRLKLEAPPDARSRARRAVAKLIGR